MVFISKGSGKTLLLLHGYLCDKSIFYKQINFFSNYYTVIAVDLSGFGQNPPLNKPYSLDDYIADLLLFLKEQNITCFDCIAHSFGGRLMLKSHQLQSMCNRLVLTGCAGLKPRFSIKKTLKIWRYKLLKKFNPKSKNLEKIGSCDYKRLNPIYKQSFIKIINEYLDKNLKNIKNNTLIIFGELDKETPPYMAKKLHKGIKNSKLYFIKNSGHFAFLEKHQEFNYVVKTFLLEGNNNE